MILELSKNKIFFVHEDKYGWREIEGSKDKFRIFRDEDQIKIYFKSMNPYGFPEFCYAYYSAKATVENEEVIVVDGKIVMPTFNKVAYAFFVIIATFILFFDAEHPVNNILPFTLIMLVVLLNTYFVFRKLKRKLFLLA